MIESLKRIVPAKIKRPVKKAILSLMLRQTAREIANLPECELPSRDLLGRLQIGWGNYGYSADLDYLEAVARTATESAGPILECGTGLTTILLGLLTGKRDVCVHSLEHDEVWHQRVTKVARKLGLNRVRIHFAPLKDYGGYWWYQPPFNSMSKHFSLVICDGPQESTPGGRYGLLPIMWERLDCALVLVDDANTLEGSKVLDRWRSEWGASAELVRNPDDAFAIVKIS